MQENKAIKTDSLTYYSQPGPMTDPGPYTGLLDNLPADMPSLVKTLQGVIWGRIQ
jgi:hypothetical protein